MDERKHPLFIWTSRGDEHRCGRWKVGRRPCLQQERPRPSHKSPGSKHVCLFTGAVSSTTTSVCHLVPRLGCAPTNKPPVRSSTVAPRPSKRETGAPGCRAGQVTPVQGCNRSPLWPGPPHHPTPGFKPSFPAIKELSGSSVDNQVVSLQGGGLRGPAGMVRRAFAWGRDSVLGPSADFCSTRESGLWSLWVEQEDAALTRLI